MTVLAIMNAVSCGTGTDIGDTFNPTKTALEATTTALKISCKLSLASGGGANFSSKIRIYHATSQISYTSALAGALALKPGAEYVELNLAQSASADMERASDLLITAAGYHYCWVLMPILPTAGALTVNLEQLP